MKKYKCLLLLLIMMVGITSVNAAPCKVVKGSGEQIGDEISCGTENFYVIRANQGEMVLFAKYNLKVGKNWFTDSTGVLQSVSVTGSDVGIQSKDCIESGSIDGRSYIATCSEYATVEVKEQYFNNYYNYLKNTVKIMGNLTVLQPDMTFLEQSGCKYTIYQEVSNIPTEDVNCQDSGASFLYSTSYLLSKEVSIVSGGKVVLTEYPTLEQSGKSNIRTLPYGAGYRPAVIMKKDNIFEAKEITNENDQIVDVKDTFKTSYIGYCLGTIILIFGIMVIYQNMRRDKKEIKIKDK